MNCDYATALKEQEPGPKVLAALGALLSYDMYLLKVDANERSVTCRLAAYYSAAQLCGILEKRAGTADNIFNRNALLAHMLAS